MKPKMQIKITVDSELASAFKNACFATKVSMASSISQFMADYSDISLPKKGALPDYSSKRKRRAAIGKIVKQLEQLRDCEQAYCDRIPENLRGSSVYDKAEEFISVLEAVIDELGLIS